MLIVVYLVVMALLTVYALTPGLPTGRRRRNWIAAAQQPDGPEPRTVREPPPFTEQVRPWARLVVPPVPDRQVPDRPVIDQPAYEPVAAPTAAERTEARLAAKLFAGELTAVRYQNAMALLAARDAVHRPLSVPPERNT